MTKKKIFISGHQKPQECHSLLTRTLAALITSRKEIFSFKYGLLVQGQIKDQYYRVSDLN
jgi:hypothetical protein